MCGDNWKDNFGDLISYSVICARSDGKDAYNGDPDGSLSININDKDYRIGLISFGDNNCGERPSLFQNIGHRNIKKFIDENTCVFITCHLIIVNFTK